MPQSSRFVGIARWLAVVASALMAAPLVAEPPDFEHDVEPILRRHCWRCHGGPNAEGDLQLTSRAQAIAERDFSDPAIVPGDAAASPLIARVADAQAGDLMPLDGKPLAAAEIDVLKRWIDAGAIWPESAGRGHWAYVPPVRPELPEVEPAAGADHPIDRFIQQRLHRKGWQTAPAAEPAVLARRAALVLTGLPLPVERVAAFEADPTPQAYEQLIDELLASPAFGEHWARHWLDLARFSDSNGYQADQLRDTWAYRDWVIAAFHQNKPFDEFVIEQLAGDLLDEPTLDQQIATGFHRMTTCNVEAGVDPEENRVLQVFDRVNTTGAVFLGATLECAQCHDHKYDPISQHEYYQLFAFFNNTPLEVELESGVQYNFVGPKLTLPLTPDQQQRREELAEDLARVETRIRELRGEASASSSASDDETSETDAAEAIKPFQQRAQRLKEQLNRLQTTTLVMVEMDAPRETRLLNRGEYLDPGDVVEPGTPSVLHPFESRPGANRLDFARWLVDRRNPLLARVTVNRLWGEVFGRPLVSTPEDFGTQAERPSHPELLDWLAVEFMESGWDVKHMVRLMVTSGGFRQRSAAASSDWRRDPENTWLARGPRFRLPAEVIRDNALAASGLISLERGGPPVMPYQPPNLWKAVGRNRPIWETAEDHHRYRRGIYVVWKRGAPYPSFVNFDAPDRASCTVNRPRTNTPLQALTLLNDPAYAEAALGLAQRVLSERREATLDEQLTYAFRLCVARAPQPRELAILTRLLELQREQLAERPQQVQALLNNLPERWREQGLDRLELAAWFAVANALLNLDETISVN